jgi:hypothetical protein
MTVVIVALLGGRTPEEWQKWVKERVDKKSERSPRFVKPFPNLADPAC